MSKIEVDAITEQSGSTLTTGGGAGKTVVVDATTVTLGRCGGTVALASGASQTGFGRTGTVDWNTTPKTSTFTAVSGDGFFANTSGGAFTMNLPAGVAGAIVSVADYAGTWQNNALTVSPNGTDKIGGVNADSTLTTEGQSVTFVFVDSTQGWINTMDSTSNVRSSSFICASVSGSCNTLVTVDTNFKVATFKGPGTFTVNSGVGSKAKVDYLVVAGGGGGGNLVTGGGGAGGFRESHADPVSGPYTASPLITTTSLPLSPGAFPIQVGGGGAGSSTSPNTSSGGNGGNSVFSTITSTGGGGGGDDNGSGQPGGSGGGRLRNSPGNGNTPPVSPPQGNNGGDGDASGGHSGGGGGGATAVGQTGSPSPLNGGNGGAGATTEINGSSKSFAGGGGGSASVNTSQVSTGGNGGLGGGGAASFQGPNPTGKQGGVGFNNGANGTSGSGATGAAGGVNSGGGAGSGSHGGGNGGAGGSGIVVIRYKFQ